MFMNVKSGLVFGLLLSIGAYAEEQGTTQANEVTDEIIKTWCEEKKRDYDRNTADIPDGKIERSEGQGNVYLKTMIHQINPDKILVEEQSTLVYLLNKKFKQLNNKNEWAILDANTRCCLSLGFLECVTCLKKEKFEEKIRFKKR